MFFLVSVMPFSLQHLRVFYIFIEFVFAVGGTLVVGRVTSVLVLRVFFYECGPGFGVLNDDCGVNGVPCSLCLGCGSCSATFHRSEKADFSCFRIQSAHQYYCIELSCSLGNCVSLCEVSVFRSLTGKV